MERSGKIAADVLAELGLNGSQVAQLQELPYQKLIEAGGAVQRKNARVGLPNIRRMADTLVWAPVVDGTVLPRHPFDPDAPAISAQVPMLVGTVLNEFLNGIDHPEYEVMTIDEVKKRVGDMYGDKSAQIIEVFQQAHPKEKPFDILSRIAASNVRQGAVTQCERKAAQAAAPAYLYWFTWKTPVLDAQATRLPLRRTSLLFRQHRALREHDWQRPRSAASRRPSQRSVDSLRSHRQSEPPRHPHMARLHADKCPTMIFDTPCEMKNNPDTTERKATDQT